MTQPLKAAPPWVISRWLNSAASLSLEQLRGRVIIAGAFQMLCPGCVEHCIPQLKRVHAMFPADQVAVIGLHTVFEHHGAMNETALRAFLHEYRVTFPVGIDRTSENGPMPATMQLYGMQGTPTTILIDRKGLLRRQTFGHMPDLQLDAEIMALMRQGSAIDDPTVSPERLPGCTDHGCGDIWNVG